MELNEIKNFLRNKPGYLKEGGKRLRKILLSRGVVSTVATCKEAIRQVRNELKTKEYPLTKKEVVESQGERPLKVLIYDIETSYNIVSSWRVGYNLNISPDNIIKERAIICVSYKWAGEDQVYNLTWDKNQDDRFLIEQFVEVMNEADLLVAHNGDRFDLKWLKTRALKHGVEMLIDYPQFDTLKIAKKKLLLNSNKLDYISKFLGQEGKIKTNYKLWDDIILRHCPKALQEMLDYCDEDVRQLEHVYNVFVGLEKPKTHLGVLQGKTKQTSPITGGVNIEHVKAVVTGRGTIKHIMRDLDTNRFFEMSDTNYKKHNIINE